MVLTRRADDGLAQRGEGVNSVVSKCAWALLYNSLGRYAEAATLVPLAIRESCEPGMGTEAWELAEFVEAAARSGKSDEAMEALQRLAEATLASGSDWGLGILARSRALLCSTEEAESYYLEAIERLGRTTLLGELARARLVYGEWLRRQKRRQDARVALRESYDLFASRGMEGFAERAGRELAAAGEKIPNRPTGSSSKLTPHENQIVRCVCEGLTNPEIGDRLFISSRTVEWHLRKIFVKLGITSRKQLRNASR
jgi:ATP/maltotriose-dependent transcriptional regulator MalT